MPLPTVQASAAGSLRHLTAIWKPGYSQHLGKANFLARQQLEKSREQQCNSYDIGHKTGHLLKEVRQFGCAALNLGSLGGNG